jgi:PLP dependent protein
LRAALDAGLTTFGENRVQEAEPKIAALPAARWEMVGHLQSNKAARAVQLFASIQSADSLELVRRIARMAAAHGQAPYPVYLQVNVDADPAKQGFSPAELEQTIAELATLPNLELRGLMTVGRLTPDPEAARPTFGRLRELSQRLRRAVPELGAGLSMGMSDDFEVAVEEGATVVRVGRALFGERPTA